MDLLWVWCGPKQVRVRPVPDRSALAALPAHTRKPLAEGSDLAHSVIRRTV